jgi:hypothetical protein
MTFAIILFAVLWAPVVWYATAMNFAIEQRMGLIATATGSSTLLADIARVGFDRHLWFVLTFRNYRRLYSSATWRANGWTRR